MKANLVKLLRIVALIEGVSFLALLFVAMPLKYMADQPQYVTQMGWLHGWLFVGYTVLLLATFALGAIAPRRFGLGLAAGFLPFGTFFNDPGLRRDQQAAGQTAG